ncbi:Fc.00g032600.m01.CDS01 [Cosmosporella sp. VM-42]
MDSIGDLKGNPRGSFKNGLFQLVHRRKRGRADDFGRKAQVGQFMRDRENAEQGELLYTDHIPPRLPQNKNPKRDVQAIQKFMDRGNTLLFDRHPNLRTTNIRIQSPILRAELRTMLADYDLDFDDEDGVLISAPFEPLFFARHDIWRRFQRLKELMDESGEEEEADLAETYDHMKLLIEEVLNDDMAMWIEEAENLRKEKKISYNLLWTLFPHGSIVVAKDFAGYQQAYQVQKFEYVAMGDDSHAPVMFDITCKCVYFDAYRFGFVTKSLTIGFFTGKKDLKDLDIIPLEVLPNFKELSRQMIKRGRKMLQYQDVQHVQIKPAQLENSQQNYDEILKDLARADTHGRAIVDFFTGVRRNARWRQTVKPLEDPQPSLDTSSESAQAKAKGKGKAGVGEPSHGNQTANNVSFTDDLGRTSSRAATTEELGSTKRPSKAIQEDNKRLVELDDVNSLLMCPLLHVFSLRSKMWTHPQQVTVNVDSVSPVDFHSNAFDHLVADEKYKSRLLSLVKGQLLDSEELIPGDPIPEKGRGLLVLLSGPPGTGKTLMAESIAEKAQRPLYYVDARDLGTSIAEIAANFTVIMENAREWNAVVLLDEADIYLQTRHLVADSHSSDRTTAFLRQLEYFQGILFLTTNLPETIDPAIESRIHINLRFPPLTQAYRVSIWQHFLEAVPAELKSLSKGNIHELRRWNINGRQIKNAFRMCGAYCVQEGKKISLQDLEDMIGMTCPSAVKEPGDSTARKGEDSRDGDESQLDVKSTAELQTTITHAHPSSSSSALGCGLMQANTPNGDLSQVTSSPDRLSISPKGPPPLPAKPLTLRTAPFETSRNGVHESSKEVE